MGGTMKKAAAGQSTTGSFQALSSGRISAKEYVQAIQVETRKLVSETPMPKRPATSNSK
ncbi:MAG: hypothetical protein QOF51_4126 [Chloroflexota bacterium]|nr:hypothetical protein [Chloroflexota bacterium]